MHQFTTAKLEIFIPRPYIDELRNELNKIGVGVIGHYDNCISFSIVEGYWRPLEGSTPFNGAIGEVSYGTGCKVEVNCDRSLIRAAKEVAHKLHPYDEVLINVIPLANHLFE